MKKKKKVSLLLGIVNTILFVFLGIRVFKTYEHTLPFLLAFWGLSVLGLWCWSVDLFRRIRQIREEAEDEDS